MLPEAAGRVHELGSQGQQVAPAGGVHPVAEGGKLPHLELQRGGIVGVQLLGQQGKLVLGQTQGLAQVLDGALDAVSGDCPGEYGEFRAEALVNAADEFVA